MNWWYPSMMKTVDNHSPFTLQTSSRHPPLPIVISGRNPKCMQRNTACVLPFLLCDFSTQCFVFSWCTWVLTSFWVSVLMQWNLYVLWHWCLLPSIGSGPHGKQWHNWLCNIWNIEARYVLYIICTICFVPLCTPTLMKTQTRHTYCCFCCVLLYQVGWALRISSELFVLEINGCAPGSLYSSYMPFCIDGRVGFFSDWCHVCSVLFKFGRCTSMGVLVHFISCKPFYSYICGLSIRSVSIEGWGNVCCMSALERERTDWPVESIINFWIKTIILSTNLNRLGLLCILLAWCVSGLLVNEWMQCHCWWRRRL